jgi:AcrR family transcriptional regulator
MASGSGQGVDSHEGIDRDIGAHLRGRPARPVDRRDRGRHARQRTLGVRIDEVAHRAGCSRATVYRYVADKDELVREVLVRLARVRSARIERELAHVTDPAETIAEGVLRTVEAIRHEWWYEALEGRGATAAVARIGGGPQAFTALATPLVTPFLARLSASGRLREDITDAEATEWLVVVTVGLLTMEMSPERPRAERARFLRRFVAYSLLRPG